MKIWGPDLPKNEFSLDLKAFNFSSPTSGRKPDTLPSSPEGAHLAILYAKVR